MIVLYGIPNCDTVKKTLNWFDANKIPVEFHDYKKQSISETKLKTWIRQVGYNILINKKSTTWKTLSAEEQQIVTNQSSAIALIVKYTSIIKRPVIEVNGKIEIIGFNEKEYIDKFL